MVCFCKNLDMPTMPRDSFRVSAPPPQLGKMFKLMNLQANLNAQLDTNLAQLLPENSNWLEASLVAQAPHGSLPPALPPRGGPVLSMAARLALPAALLPLDNLEALAEELMQTIASLEAHVLPPSHDIGRMPSSQIKGLALGAHMTLQLRSMGLCPFEVMELELAQSGAAGGASAASYGAAMNFSRRLPSLSLPAFALPLPKMHLALRLAGIAKTTAVLQQPSLTPAFVAQMKRQLDALCHLPIPSMKTSLMGLMAYAAELADLDVIHEAFGEDALTPSGLARINAMFAHWSKMRVPIPLPALALQAQFEALPELQDVLDGARTTKAAGPALMSSMSMTPPAPPILPLLEVVAAISGLLGKFLGQRPFGACSACEMAFG